MLPLVILSIHCINAIAHPTNAFLQDPNSPDPTASATIHLSTEVISTRSRLDIIWSCFATIFACTWVAVHPNIPAPQDSEWKVLRQRLKIMVYTLLVPELVLYWASKQWYAAKQAAKKHKGKGWTKVHGFFIGMGGICLSEEGSPPRPFDLEYLEDAVDLGTMEWPEISEEDILDKSNSDYFTKAVVLIQIGWFIFQCIARTVWRLCLTELEVITLAYAALSGTMYFFWWHKPLDVRRPIIIHGKTCASSLSMAKVDALAPSQILVGKDFNLPSPRSSTHLSLRRCRSLPSSVPSVESRIYASSPTQGTSNSTYFENVTEIDSMSLVPCPLPPAPDRSGHGYRNHFTTTKPPNRRRKYLLPLIYPFRVLIDDCNEMRDSGTISPSGISPFYAAIRLRLRHVLSILLFLLGTIFGAIHCIAWYFEFPTTIEQWAWRGATLGILVLPSIIAMNYLFSMWLSSYFFIEPRFDQFNFVAPFSGILAVAGSFMEGTSLIRLSVLFFLYIVSRIVLLALPLIELRSLPLTAYQTISWTDFLA